MKSTFAWSVRRELWESRAIYFAPLGTAALVLLAFLFNVRGAAEKVGIFATLTPAKQVGLVVMPFSLAASVIILTTFIVAVFYSLDALNAERRDRSILFWKSMPVSDRTTVLSKAFVPFVMMPVIGFVVAFTTQLILLVVSAAVLRANGVDLGPLWERLPLFQMTLVMLYSLVIHSLWYAPFFAALLLVSLLAKRAPFLWAVVPLFVVQVLERIAFGTAYISGFLKYRLLGAMTEAFVPNALNVPITSLSQLDPARFFSSPGLWFGLVFAVVFLTAAIRLRRHREPI